jgi:hypothetical protein
MNKPCHARDGDFFLRFDIMKEAFSGEKVMIVVFELGMGYRGR